MKTILTALLLSTISVSCVTHAGVVSTYNDFTYDSDNNYVSGAGAQWLRWDETLNMSIADVQANTQLQAQGWRVADRDSVLNLFKSWFGKTRLFKFFPTADELAAQNTFQQFFGRTSERYDSFFGNWIYSSQTMFLNERGAASMAEVWIDGDFINFEIDSAFDQPVSYQSNSLGILLMRNATAVSSPAPFLLILGGFALALRLRRKV